MTLVINQLLDQQSLNDENPTQAPTDNTDEIPPESAMPFWDWCPESDDEQIEEVFIEDTPVIKVVSQRNYNLCNKGPIPNDTSSKEDKIPLRKITPPPAPPKPNDTTQGKTSRKTSKVVPTNTNKPSTSSLNWE
jgi:hypothetical protein